MSVQKGVAKTVGFDLVSTAGVEDASGTPTTQISKDGGAYAATTNAASRIGSTGSFSLALTSTEMTADLVKVRAVATGDVPVFLNFYTEADYTTAKAAYLVSPPTNWGSTNIDSSGRVLLQPTQAGVTIPTVTTLTNAPSDSSGVGTLLTRLPSAITFTGANVNATTQNFPAKQAATLNASDVTGNLPANAVQWGGSAVTGMPMPTFTYTAPLTSAETAAAVLNATAADYDDAGSIGSAISAAGGSGDPWATALPGAYTAGQAGYVIGHNVDAQISSRSIFAGGAVASVAADVSITQDAADKVWASAERTLTSFGALAASIAAAVWSAGVRTLSAFGFSVDVADKTGFSLATSPPTSDQIAAKILVNPTHLLATDSSGNVAANNLPVEVLTSAEQGQLTDAVNDLTAILGRTDTAPTVSTIATAVATLLTRLPASITFTNGNVNANAQVVADKTNYALTSNEHNNIEIDMQDAMRGLGYDEEAAVGLGFAGETAIPALYNLLTPDLSKFTSVALANAPGSTGALTTDQDAELAAIAAALDGYGAPGTATGIARTQDVQFTEGSDDL